MEKGKYVLRSTYQKLAEENKKLIQDISILVKPGMPSLERIQTIDKWRKKFDSDNKLHGFLKFLAEEHFKANPKDTPKISKYDIRKRKA